MKHFFLFYTTLMTKTVQNCYDFGRLNNGYSHAVFVLLSMAEKGSVICQASGRGVELFLEWRWVWRLDNTENRQKHGF